MDVDMEISSKEPNENSSTEQVDEESSLPSWLSKAKLRSGYSTFMALKTVIIIPWNPDIIKQPVVASWLGECCTYTIKKLSSGVSAGELVFANTDTGDVAYLDLKQNLDKINVQVSHPALSDPVNRVVVTLPDYRYKNEFDDKVGLSHPKNFYLRLVIVEKLPPHFNTEDMLYQLFPEAETVLSFEHESFAKGIAILEFESVDARTDFMEIKGPEVTIDDDVKVQLYSYTARCREYHKYQSYMTRKERTQFRDRLRPLEAYERVHFNREMNELRSEYQQIHNSDVIFGSAKLDRIHEMDFKLAELSAILRFDNSHRKSSNLPFPEEEDEMQPFTKHMKEETYEDIKQRNSVKELEKQRKKLENEYNNNNVKIRSVEKLLTAKQKAERRKKPRESLLLKVDLCGSKKRNESETIENLKKESEQLLQELHDLKTKHAQMKNNTSTVKLHAVAEVKKKVNSIPSLMSVKVPSLESDDLAGEIDLMIEEVESSMDCAVDNQASSHVEEEYDYKSLFVNGFVLTPTIDSDLKELFSLANKIITTKKRKNYGFSYILYDTEGKCSHDFAKNQGIVLNGLPLTVQYKKKSSRIGKERYARLHITGFPDTMEKDKIRKLLIQICGRNNGLSYKVDGKDGPYWVVSYGRPKHRNFDFEKLQGRTIEGHLLNVALYETVIPYEDDMGTSKTNAAKQVALPELTGNQHIALNALKTAASTYQAELKNPTIENNKPKKSRWSEPSKGNVIENPQKYEFKRGHTDFTNPDNNRKNPRYSESSKGNVYENPQRYEFNQGQTISVHDNSSRMSRLNDHQRNLSDEATVRPLLQSNVPSLLGPLTNQHGTTRMQPNIIPSHAAMPMHKPFAETRNASQFGMPVPSFNNSMNQPISINEVPGLPLGQHPVVPIGQPNVMPGQNMMMQGQRVEDTEDTGNDSEVHDLFRGITEVLSAKIRELEQSQQDGNAPVSQDQITDDLRERLDQILPNC